MQKLRARNPEDKRVRREQILAEALLMLDQVSYPNFIMNALALRLDLAKGTLYLYFPTKEELFLTLFERLLGDWFNLLETRLATERWNAATLANLFAQTLSERPKLARLFPLLESIFERNISLEKAKTYKLWLLLRTAPIALGLERHLGLKSGQGIKMLAYAQALISGLQQMTDLSPEVREVLQQPDLDILKMEFAPDLEAALTALFSGMK